MTVVLIPGALRRHEEHPTDPADPTDSTSTATQEMHRFRHDKTQAQGQAQPQREAGNKPKPAERVFPIADAIIYPVTLWTKPYFSEKDLRDLGITCVPMRFADGALPRGHETFLTPTPPSQLHQWLSISIPWTSGPRAGDITRGGGPQRDDNYTEARAVWGCIRKHLFHGNDAEAS